MLARMNGKVVGVVANNPMFGGIVDVKAARKQTHFIDLCDAFNIPLVFFVDVPGLLIGVESESEAIMRFGIQQRYVLAQATVPIYTVLVRKCFGVAGGSVIDRSGLNFKIAWPSASWGSLPIEGESRRPTAPTSRAPPIRPRAKPRSRPSCGRCLRRSALPRLSRWRT